VPSVIRLSTAKIFSAYVIITIGTIFFSILYLKYVISMQKMCL